MAWALEVQTGRSAGAFQVCADSVRSENSVPRRTSRSTETRTGPSNRADDRSSENDPPTGSRTESIAPGLDNSRLVTSAIASRAARGTVSSQRTHSASEAAAESPERPGLLCSSWSGLERQNAETSTGQVPSVSDLGHRLRNSAKSVFHSPRNDAVQPRSRTRAFSERGPSPTSGTRRARSVGEDHDEAISGSLAWGRRAPIESRTETVWDWARRARAKRMFKASCRPPCRSKPRFPGRRTAFAGRFRSRAA